MKVVTELKNRGVADVLFLVCDGLKGLPDSANAFFPLATVQTYVIHLIRGWFRYASKRHWEALSRALRPIYTAPTVEAAWAAFESLQRSGARPTPRYPSCGGPTGRSSPRSWPTTWRSDACTPKNKRTAQARLVEGAVTKSWNAALGELALATPDRINAYL